MPKKKSPPEESKEISEVLQVSQGQLECCLIGDTGLISNRLSEKAKRQLLLPPVKTKGKGEVRETLKHTPLAEYRDSIHRLVDGPTLIAMPSTAFKGALRSAAVDMPGMAKSQIGRLTYLKDDYVPVYGIPELFMTPVRLQGINKTPDIRTRALIRRWACRVTVTFVQPLIRPQAVANLFAAAGITIGVGDGRAEKGALSYGMFRICDADDPDFLSIIAKGGREAQIAAMEHPAFYDQQSSELFEWFNIETARRSLRGVA